MRRRDVIQALCGLLGVGTLATGRVRAAAPRQILLARLHVAGTAYYDAKAAADRLRPGQRLALRRQPENRYDALAIEVLGPEGHKLGYVPRRRKRDARPADGRRQAPVRADGIDRAARQLAEHPGLAVPGRCLNRPVDGAPGPRRAQAVRCPSPSGTRGSTDWHGRTRRPKADPSPSPSVRCGGDDHPATPPRRRQPTVSDRLTQRRDQRECSDDRSQPDAACEARADVRRADRKPRRRRPRPHFVGVAGCTARPVRPTCGRRGHGGRNRPGADPGNRARGRAAGSRRLRSGRPRARAVSSSPLLRSRSRSTRLERPHVRNRRA